MKQIKAWKIVRIICIVFLAATLVPLTGYLIYRGHIYMGMTYPQPMLGVDVSNWMEALMIDAALILYVSALPLFAAVLFLIISVINLRNLKKKQAPEGSPDNS